MRAKAKAGTQSTHKRLRVIAGTVAGKQLVSGRGPQTRPMMEKVRAAVFNMLAARTGAPLPIP